jgi:hypothetical protein
VAQLTQSISQFALKSGGEDIKKKAGGGSGDEKVIMIDQREDLFK